MSRKIQIVLNGHLDRAEIVAALAADSTYIIDVVDNYVNPETVLSLDVFDLDATNKEAFYKTLDNATHLVEAAALIWKIQRTGKVFDLNDSFVRDAVSTDGTLTKIPDGTPLKACFEIPGFAVNTIHEFVFWIAEDFNPIDLTALDAMGITVTGDGGYFEIANLTECKVSFSVPSGVTDVYIIDDPNSATAIAV